MRAAQLYRYQVPMDAGVVLRERRLKTRDGLLVRLRDNGREGWGDIAPLPGFSEETLDAALPAARDWLLAWQRGDASALPAMASVAFGLSLAQAELHGTLPQAGNYHVAPLCTGDPDELFARLAGQRGDNVAKVKVGLYEAVRDGMVVNLLLEALPALRLRLDANRAWTPVKAQQFAKYVNPAYRSRIEFIEEPCKTPDDSRAFAAHTGIAIAWDESLRERGFTVAAEHGLRAVVIKPTLTGSLERVREQIACAHAAGLTAVISSSLESSLGLTQLARLAAWLTPGVTPGLDTLALMQAQLVRPWPDSPLPCWSVDALEPLL
ncbi:o-succinylbenzoate synthase [Cronobacter turicensis]|uniref:o-succinylbenzoate synthase n=1 Tax=Cronobacter turicensis TaxID=413502 RepID=UPI00357139B1